MKPRGGMGGRWQMPHSREPPSLSPEEEEKSKVKERRLRGKFGKESIINLRNRLKEEASQKFVYLFTWPFYLGPINALIVDMEKPNEARLMESELPSGVKNLRDFGCTVWTTKIIIAGGNYGKECPSNKGGNYGKECPSNKVFVFDTVSKEWAPPLRMKLKRGRKPIVVVVDSKLFVFGGSPEVNLNDSDMMHMGDYDPKAPPKYPFDPRHVAIYKKHWAEICCNIDDSTGSWSWDYLPPSHRFPCGRLEIPRICSHAVYPKKSLILFYDTSCGGALSFDYNTGIWEKFKSYMPINSYFSWSAAVVVLEDFLFWHRKGVVYAHDLLENVTFPVYKLSCPDFFARVPTFLVHAGKGTLCLFTSVCENRVWYCTFLVNISLGRELTRLVLIPDQHGILNAPIPVADIKHALECST